MKLKRKDKVVVLVGRDKGKTGSVARVLPASGRVVVDGVNVMKRHTKPSKAHPGGGVLELVRPLPAGKVALVCPSCKQPTRVGYKISGDNKERICRKCQGVIK
ncbi:50S ribosomal protein L24 [Candidatus Parcubacteria bacterium]|nr:50S ribosomal protein L24 [Candidatus Parcubacteria bacterium]